MKLDNQYKAIEQINGELVEHLKTIEHDDFDEYPNVWCHILDYTIDRKWDELEEEYSALILPFIENRLKASCEPAVINWLFLEYHNAFQDNDYDEENPERLNTDNYKTYPLSDDVIKGAAAEVFKNFFVNDNYDLQEERIEGYKLRYLTKVDAIEEATQALIKFRDERDWKQFHNPKDLALAISVEAGELLEVFLWKNHDDADGEKIKEELADIFLFALLLAHEKGLDVKDIVLNKLNQNAEKYPIAKAKGNAKKYTDL